jgi:hypothetical protein
MKHKIHFITGFTISLLYIYVVFNTPIILPGIPTAFETSGVFHGDPKISVIVAMLLPCFSILCLMFPDRMSRWFSPKTSLLGERIVTPGAWIILGYFSFILSVILLSVYV